MEKLISLEYDAEERSYVIGIRLVSECRSQTKLGSCPAGSQDIPD